MNRCESVSKIQGVPREGQRRCHLLADHGERHHAGAFEWDDMGNAWFNSVPWKSGRGGLASDGGTLAKPKSEQVTLDDLPAKHAGIPSNVPVPPSRYDEDYFEHGLIAGVSGYMNYSWMPERTLRMAHKLIQELPIKPGERVLDFGCAKGFLVKALRILDVEAWGVDVSEYAIAHVDAEVREFCAVTRGSLGADMLWSSAARSDGFDWLIAKDVFEHLTEDELRHALDLLARVSDRLFVAVPLGDGERFVIPSYDADVTHRLAKQRGWWEDRFVERGWTVTRSLRSFPGCKDDWTARYPDGNGFFVLVRR